MPKATESEKALLELDGVETVQTTIGGGGFGFGGASANEVSFSITTDPDADQEALLDTMVTTLEALPEPGTIEAADIASPTGSSSVDILITGPTAEDRAVLERCVGVLRDEARLAEAITALRPGAEDHDARLVALLIAWSAYRRTESRGGHHRTDHPRPGRGGHTVLTLDQALAEIDGRHATSRSA